MPIRLEQAPLMFENYTAYSSRKNTGRTCNGMEGAGKGKFQARPGPCALQVILYRPVFSTAMTKGPPSRLCLETRRRVLLSHRHLQLIGVHKCGTTDASHVSMKFGHEPGAHGSTV